MGKRNRVGRNNPCPCGSGKKYKKCCESKQKHDFKEQPKLPPDVLGKIRSMHHTVLQNNRVRKQLFGNVRPMIHADFNDFKFVAVGNEVHWSKEWKTFQDFLLNYIKYCLGEEWGTSEIKKPFPERHTILQWYKYLCDFQRKHIVKVGEIYSVEGTGPVAAYMSLAYDLYILRHHSHLQKTLIDRIKSSYQFQGARYELYVISSFIKAGFEIEFEDETERSSSHCEFNAISHHTGRQYSLEAKSRHRPGFLGQDGEKYDLDKIRLRIGGLINDALKKHALYDRIIFIDVNMPPSEGILLESPWFQNLSDIVKQIEGSEINGKPCPSAYLFFTNHPHHYVGDDEPEPMKDFIFTAINIPDFKVDDSEKAQLEHPDMLNLLNTILTRDKVPHEFE